MNIKIYFHCHIKVWIDLDIKLWCDNWNYMEMEKFNFASDKNNLIISKLLDTSVYIFPNLCESSNRTSSSSSSSSSLMTSMDLAEVRWDRGFRSGERSERSMESDLSRKSSSSPLTALLLKYKYSIYHNLLS